MKILKKIEKYVSFQRSKKERSCQDSNLRPLRESTRLPAFTTEPTRVWCLENRNNALCMYTCPGYDSSTVNTRGPQLERLDESEATKTPRMLSPVNTRQQRRSPSSDRLLRRAESSNLQNT